MKATIKALALATLILFALTSCMSTKTESTVQVSGSGTVYLKADMVTFSINVSETADTTGEAQQAANAKITAILDVLRAFSIKDDDISTTALNFSSDYYWENGRSIKAGETVSQTVYVTLRNVDAFPELADRLGSELSGISFYNVNFDSSEKAEASIQARELAYANALSKAQSYAKYAGLEVSEPIEISEVNYSYGNAAYKTTAASALYMVEEAAMDYGTQTPSGLLSVTINVNAKFGLE